MGSQVHGTQAFDNKKRAELKFNDAAMAVVNKIISNYPEGKQKSE